jgi:hypothetical protein
MVVILVEGTEPLRIDDDQGKRVIIRRGKDFLPKPEPLGARVDRGPHLETAPSAVLGQWIQEEAVKYVRFSSTVLATDGNHSHFGLDLREEFCGFRVDLELVVVLL